MFDDINKTIINLDYVRSIRQRLIETQGLTPYNVIEIELLGSKYTLSVSYTSPKYDSMFENDYKRLIDLCSY